jgi:hypothetical protein
MTQTRELTPAELADAVRLRDEVFPIILTNTRKCFNLETDKSKNKLMRNRQRMENFIYTNLGEIFTIYNTSTIPYNDLDIVRTLVDVYRPFLNDEYELEEEDIGFDENAKVLYVFTIFVSNLIDDIDFNDRIITNI